MRLFLSFAFALHATGSVAATGPEAAVRTLYKAYENGKAVAPNAGIEKIWQLAGPQLRRRLVANGVCTIPLRKRTFQCALEFDPIVGGVRGARLVEVVKGAAESTTQRFVARLVSQDAVQTVTFIFERSAGAGARGRPALIDVEGALTGTPPWRLSELTPFAKL